MEGRLKLEAGKLVCRLLQKLMRIVMKAWVRAAGTERRVQIKEKFQRWSHKDLVAN